MAPQAKKIGSSPGRCRIFLSIFFSYPRKVGGPPKEGKKSEFPNFQITGGGRIRDVASLIRRTDEPEIKKNFWGKKSKKTFSPEAKKIFEKSSISASKIPVTPICHGTLSRNFFERFDFVTKKVRFRDNL